MNFLKILQMDKYSYAFYKCLNEDQKKEFEKKYKKTFRFKFHQLNYLMRRYLKWLVRL